MWATSGKVRKAPTKFFVTLRPPPTTQRMNHPVALQEVP
jgi:hypothetical protein